MTKGIISLGEALIDFIPLDDNNETFQKSPGGAPANVAVGLARLDAKTSFLGKVGDDVLGRFLKDTLDSYGVDTSNMRFTKDTRTGVVFVTLGEGGERSFEFYIDPSADRFLEEAEVDESLFDSHNLLHFGSISLISEPAKSATKKAVRTAREKGLIVSYDPNLRLGLWTSEDQAREEIRSMLGEADVLKISEEELEFITGESHIEKGVAKLDEFHIPLIFITLGAEGSYIFLNGQAPVKVEAMKVKAVDTTGAGDAFVSGILYQLHLLEKPLKELTADEIKEMARFASVSGGLAASTKGAMTALPTLDEVKTKMSEY
ncbi:aminoimidazole riboside kinase [Salipaludibacillus sp. CUR1]|uniref:aminoimidazole riboside kinase n=1 Tax=Salipaludibacillus sp. CUR1 TaxID=2820003 RepID=UPI001E55FB36|nr:aminoimidazole riboside kinase [Salipaludibacillus sp. CUR1]MCE7791364.1 aminoimidazole riboside kinase [Salipaludibacillus sp. CUR1]